MTREGFPEKLKDDLRFYQDQDGRFTPQLRMHYDPRVVDQNYEIHAVFVKLGGAWMETRYDFLTPGMVAKIMDRRDKLFCTWEDTLTTEVYIMAVQQRPDGMWGVQVRRPTPMELAEA